MNEMDEIRNTIIKTIDSLMSRNMDQFAIELTDTLLNVYINKKPKFGNISGLEDQNGTFFFIKK